MLTSMRSFPPHLLSLPFTGTRKRADPLVGFDAACRFCRDGALITHYTELHVGGSLAGEPGRRDTKHRCPICAGPTVESGVACSYREVRASTPVSAGQSGTVPHRAPRGISFRCGLGRENETGIQDLTCPSPQGPSRPEIQTERFARC
jgi:hypothetical protein